MDFFSRLSDRTQGRTPTVQPLTDSRFAETPMDSIPLDPPPDGKEPAQDRSIESISDPTLRSPGQKASTRAQVTWDVEAETRDSSPTRGTNVITSVQEHRPFVFDGPSQEVQAWTVNPLTEPVRATTHFPSDGSDFTRESVRRSRESDLLAGAHTVKADVRASSLNDVPTVPGESTVQSSHSRMTGGLLEPLFQPSIEPSHASPKGLEPGMDQPAAKPRIIPSVSIDHANQCSGPTQPSQLAEEQFEQTTDGSKLFLRPEVERVARRRVDARMQSEASFGHSDSTKSSSDSAPPVIRISIGRVEVRAVLPPAKPVERPTPARTTPNLSLDEYLKRAEKGPK